MSRAYVDSSVIVAVVLNEPGAAAIARKLATYDLVTSTLLEAEIRSAAAREDSPVDETIFNGVLWITPQRRLHAEFREVLETGYARGADLFHLACALYFFGDIAERSFLTLDAKQRELADKLGFNTAFTRA